MKVILTIGNKVVIGNLSEPRVEILSFNLKQNQFTGKNQYGDIRPYPLSCINFDRKIW
jgi:hypothetical protein